MGQINPTIPTLGDLNATEDADIRSALITIRDVLNGNIDSDNLANAAVIAAKIADNAIATAKIQDGAVTSDKLGLESFYTFLSGNLTLTTSTQLLTGCSHTTTGTGDWLIWGSLGVQNIVSGASAGIGELRVGGIAQGPQALTGDTDPFIVSTQFWKVTVSSGVALTFNGRKLSSGGNIVAQLGHTSFMGVRIS